MTKLHQQIQWLSLMLLFFGNTANIIADTHWESLITESDEFNYIVPSSALSADWILLNYNDQAWQTAAGGFGFGDDDDYTTINVSQSIYLRKTIYIPTGAEILQLLLDIDYDDAYIAYINGTEIARSDNLPEGTPGLTANLSYDHEATLYQDQKPERVVLDPKLIKEGQNILAVQVMNITTTSSDLSARVFLNAQVNFADTLYSPTPDWFLTPVDFISSNLPIIKLDTKGSTIVDEPKIMAQMQVINNANGMNNFNDTVYEYNSYCGIELRGFTSMNYAKKSYTVETRNEDGSNNNVELLGMPKENDWVFHGPYSDKSLMRNALAQHLGAGMIKWTPRTRFAEVIIND